MRWLIVPLLLAGFYGSLAMPNFKTRSVVLTYANGAFPACGFLYKEFAIAQAKTEGAEKERQLMEACQTENPEAKLTASYPAEVKDALHGFVEAR